MNTLTRREFMKTTTSTAAALAISGAAPVSALTNNPQNPAGDFELPYRQIHLDFHTSEHIPYIGTQFDADEFAGVCQQLRDAGLWRWAADVGGHGIAALAELVSIENRSPHEPELKSFEELQRWIKTLETPFDQP